MEKGGKRDRKEGGNGVKRAHSHKYIQFTDIISICSFALDFFLDLDDR